MRDTYIDAFSEGINASKFVNEVSLTNMGLTTNRAIKILKNLNKQVIKKIDLSHNPGISKEFYEELGEYIRSPACNLE